MSEETNPDRQILRRMRNQVASLLDRMDALRAQNKEVPRPRPQHEVVAKLPDRQRGMVHSVAAAVVANRRDGVDSPRGRNWNQIMDINNDRFAETYREGIRDQPVANRTGGGMDTLTAAAFAIAAGYAVGDEPLPDPTLWQDGLDISYDHDAERPANFEATADDEGPRPSADYYGLEDAQHEAADAYRAEWAEMGDEAEADRWVRDGVMDGHLIGESPAAGVEQTPEAESQTWVQDGHLIDSLDAVSDGHPHDLSDMLSAQDSVEAGPSGSSGGVEAGTEAETGLGAEV